MKLDAKTVKIHEKAISSTMELYSPIKESFKQDRKYRGKLIENNQLLIGQLVIAAAIRMDKIKDDPIVNVLNNK